MARENPRFWSLAPCERDLEKKLPVLQSKDNKKLFRRMFPRRSGSPVVYFDIFPLSAILNFL